MAPITYSILGQNLKLTTAEDIEPQLRALRGLGPEVEEVHFGGNTLGVGACEALAKELTKLQKLRVADFADIYTGRLISEIPQALKALSDALLSCPVLHEVSFSDNAFGGRSAEPMVNLISSHPTLAVLKLANNGLGPTGGNIIAEALLANAERCKREGRRSTLEVIVCGRNRLENGSADLWAKALAAHGTLKEVRLYQNGIWADGIAAIAKGLRSCPDLEIFDVQDNTATKRAEEGKPARSTGSRAIANSLKSWPALRELQLSDCLLNVGKGGVLVAKALGEGHNGRLEILRLKANEMDAGAVSELALAIKQLPNLTTLELNENYGEAEDECYEQIRQALDVHGHGDALDDLDDLEEFDLDEAEDEEAFESEEEGLVAGRATQAGQAVPTALDAKAKNDDDELAGLMSKVEIK